MKLDKLRERVTRQFMQQGNRDGVYDASDADEIFEIKIGDKKRFSREKQNHKIYYKLRES
jgi:hypothetical protein